jgi:regulation of enolase protein 1 (concanavalin A-like superfamily)
MMFPDASAYRQFWRAHPALEEAWGPELEAYVDYDLVGTAPRLHSAVSVDAVRTDSRDQFVGVVDASVLHRLDRPLTMITVPAGLLGQPPGLYPDDVMTGWESLLPQLRVKRWPDFNHYTMIMSQRGAAAVAAELQSVVLGQPTHRPPGADAMSASIDVTGLPFRLTPSHPDGWVHDPVRATVVALAPAHTDLYVNPGGTDSEDADTLLNATTLLGTPPAGDFQFSSRVQVEFASQYDAGVLLLWIDERNWAKFCFEYSPAAQPMVVSVVTRGLSDDANAFVVDGRAIWLRVSRIDGVYAYHASTDAQTWQLIRVFNLGGDPATHRLGFEAQSPTGDGCRVTFDQLRFIPERLDNLRDGS